MSVMVIFPFSDMIAWNTIPSLHRPSLFSYKVESLLLHGHRSIRQT